jgi:hypothetical protein
MIPHCEICYGRPSDLYICEVCDKFYCDDCACRFSMKNQIDYNCCIYCANQLKYSPTKQTIRENKIILTLG